MNLFADKEQVSFLPKRAIGPFTAYVLVEEAATFALEITQHPVEIGAAVSDHAYRKPRKLAIKALFDQAHTGEPVAVTFEKLVALQETREPFTIITAKMTYENMLFANMFETTDRQTHAVVAVDADFQEVIRVETQKVTVPPRDRHANPGKTGATEKAGWKNPEDFGPQPEAFGPPVDPGSTALSDLTGIEGAGSGGLGILGF